MLQVSAATVVEGGTRVAEGGAMSEEPLKPAALPPAKPSKALLALLVLNVAATGLVAFKVLTAAPAQAAPAHKEHAEAPSSEVTGPVVALDPFVVNLDELGTSRYLKVTLEMELFPQGAAALTKSKQLVR